MSKYDDLVKSMSEKVSKTGNKNHSNGDLNDLAATLLNTPEQEVTKIVATNGGESYTEVKTQPVKEHRDELKKMVVKNFGISQEEAKKLDTAPLSNGYAASMMNLATTVQGDYLSTGKKLNFPVRDAGATKMGIQQITLPEKVEETKMIAKQEDGSYKSVPTGKTIKTAKRQALKATNTVPKYLKSEVK